MLGHLVLGLGLTLLPGCFGLDENEQSVLDVHQQNSQMFYQSGSYRQALHQANMALALDEGLVGMRLIRGNCLTKLGSVRDNIDQVDEAVELFEGLCRGDGSEDYRAWLGAGQAHFARARLRKARADTVKRRLDSDFLTPDGRADEQKDFDRWSRGHREDLTLAEDRLMRVFGFDVQGDNVYAMMDLVLTLVEQGGRDDEAVAWSRRASALLVDAVALTRETLSKNTKLSPRGKLNLDRRIEDFLDKEQRLRDIVVTIEYNRGSYQRCLEEFDQLEERGLMLPVHYYNRAAIYEDLAMYAEALDDLQTYLRQRARVTTEYDEGVDDVFDRIDELERKLSAGGGS